MRAELYSAARHMPTLAAMFGPRWDVTEYYVWQVLLVSTMDIDRTRLVDAVNEKMRPKPQEKF